MSLTVQFWTLAMMLLSGVGMGIAFDSYRVLLNRLKIGRLWIPVLDLLYWLTATLIVFRILTASNEGEVRVYVFLGLFIGVGLYFLLLSKIVIRIVEWLVEAVKSFIRFLILCLDWLVLKPLLLLYRMVRVILGFFAMLTIFLVKIVVQLLSPFWLLLKWLINPLIRVAIKYLGPIWNRWRMPEHLQKIKMLAMRFWNKWLKLWNGG